MILEIDNVELYFNKNRILSGIYLKVETGKVTGILGSNGCGKTCLLNIIFGSLKPKYKLVRVNKKPTLNPLFETGLITYLPQHHFIPKIIKLKTVFKLFKVSWNDFLNVFESFNIYENFKIKKLSSGEQRLIETYIVLKTNRKIVLLDEPFSHLSPLYIEKISKLIKQEKQNKAIVITDHMYKHIIDISDTIYFLKGGYSKLIKNLKELEDYKYLSVGALN